MKKIKNIITIVLLLFCLSINIITNSNIAFSITIDEKKDKYEQLKQYISKYEQLNLDDINQIEMLLNEMISLNIKDTKAHLLFGEFCLKQNNFEKAYYHFEMIYLAEPWNIYAKKMLNDIKNKLDNSSSNLKNIKNFKNLNNKLNNNFINSDFTSELNLTKENTLLDTKSQINSQIKNKSTYDLNQNYYEDEELTINFNYSNKNDIISYHKKQIYNLIRQKNYKQAEKYVNQHCSNIDDYEINYFKAYIYYKLNKNNDAINVLEQINPEQINNVQLLYDIGMLAGKLLLFDKAIDFFLAGIEIDKSYLNNYIALAICYTQLKNYDNAIKYFNEALNINPKDIKLLYYYALLCKKLENYEDFILYANKILELDPENLYAKMIKKQLGLVPSDRLLSYNNEKLLFNSAIKYFNDGDLKKAELKLKEIISFNNNSINAHLYLSKIYQKLNKYIEYTYHLLKLDSLTSNDKLKLELARAFSNLNLNILSKEYYLLYLNKNPNDYSTKFEYANMLKEKGAIKSANVIYNTLNNLNENNLSYEVEIDNNYDNVDTNENEFKNITSDSMNNLYHLCSMLFENEVYTQLNFIISTILNNNVNLDIKILEIYGTSLVLQKRYNDAIKAYNYIIKFDKKNYNAYFEIGRIYLKKNNFKKAEEYFRAASILNNNSEILMFLGDACYYQKNYDDALIAYKEAFTLTNNIILKNELSIKINNVKKKLER